MVHDVLISLCTKSWTAEGDHTVQVSDPTERFVMLRSLNSDGSFKHPKNTTSLLAQLKYLIRICMLIELKKRSRLQNIDDSTACDQMQPWFQEKLPSTFDTLSSLQHRASAFAYETKGLPTIVWNDDSYSSMFFRGNPIKLAQVQSILRQVQIDAQQIWETKITLGLHRRFAISCCSTHQAHSCREHIKTIAGLP